MENCLATILFIVSTRVETFWIDDEKFEDLTYAQQVDDVFYIMLLSNQTVPFQTLF